MGAIIQPGFELGHQVAYPVAGSYWQGDLRPRSQSGVWERVILGGVNPGSGRVESRITGSGDDLPAQAQQQSEAKKSADPPARQKRTRKCVHDIRLVANPGALSIRIAGDETVGGFRPRRTVPIQVTTIP
jgi:hypothetical protein